MKSKLYNLNCVSFFSICDDWCWCWCIASW